MLQKHNDCNNLSTAVAETLRDKLLNDKDVKTLT